MKAYFDNAATTEIDSNVEKSMKEAFKKYGNPSSVHSLGEEARKLVESSRKKISEEIGCKANEIIFTGSGTEANNFSLKGLFFENYPKKNHIVTTKIEHESILEVCKWLETQGAEVTYLNVDKEGFISIEDLKNSITDKTFLVSMIQGNNEIGTMQDISSIGRICKEKEVLFHIDACQSFTKEKIDVKNFDLMTINAHKIHGPKGIGALFVKSGIKLSPLLHGGGQEFGLRSSTENVPAIVGFAEAVKKSKEENLDEIRELRDYIIENILKISGSKLNGSREKRLPNNINFSFDGIEAESLAAFLNEAGISISTGSACSSRLSKSSHVLLAIGRNKKDANSSIRISLSKYNSKEEANYLLENLKKSINNLRKVKI